MCFWEGLGYENPLGRLYTCVQSSPVLLPWLLQASGCAVAEVCAAALLGSYRGIFERLPDGPHIEGLLNPARRPRRFSRTPDRLPRRHAAAAFDRNWEQRTEH